MPATVWVDLVSRVDISLQISELSTELGPNILDSRLHHINRVPQLLMVRYNFWYLLLLDLHPNSDSLSH